MQRIAIVMFIPILCFAQSSVTWSETTYNIGTGGVQQFRNWNRGIYNPNTGCTEVYVGDSVQGTVIYSGAVWCYKASSNTFIELYYSRSSSSGDGCNSWNNYVSPPGPFARHPYAAAYDVVDNSTWIISGVCDGVRPADTWEFTNTGTANSGTWTLHTTSHFPSVNGNGIDSFGLAYDSVDDVVFAVGGFSNVGNIMSITSVYCKHSDPQPSSGRSIGCGSTVGDWVVLTTGGITLPAIAGGKLYWDHTINQLVWYGGQVSGGIGINTIYVYNPATQNWSQPATSGTAPSNSNTYSYGVEDTSRHRFIAIFNGSQAFALDPTTWTWSNVSYSGSGPDPTIGGSALYNQIGSDIVYAAGQDKYVSGQFFSGGGAYGWYVGTPSGASSSKLFPLPSAIQGQ